MDDSSANMLGSAALGNHFFNRATAAPPWHWEALGLTMSCACTRCTPAFALSDSRDYGNCATGTLRVSSYGQCARAARTLGLGFLRVQNSTSK